MIPANRDNEHTLEKAREVITRWRAHQCPAPKRELIAVSSDECAVFETRSTTSAEEVKFKLFGRTMSQKEIDAELKSLAADVPAESFAEKTSSDRQVCSSLA